MPTPLMPDEEFDAQFRQGLEHYPEQPEDPAAWHRMDLLLDADLRQQALRRRVLRLLGAEALLLFLGVWATFSFLLEKMPITAGSPLATVGRAATSVSPAAGAGRNFATSIPGRGTEKPVLSTPKTLLNKQPAMVAKEDSRLTDQTNSSVNKLFTAGKNAPPIQPASSPKTGQLVQLDAASRTHKAGRTKEEKQSSTRRSTLLAASHSRRARYRAANGNRAVSEKNAIITNELAGANLKQKSYHNKHRLHQSTGVNAQGLVAAGRKKTLHNTVASSENALHQAPHSLSFGNRHTAATPKTAGNCAAASAGMAAFGQPIDWLAPRRPVSGLHFQLPDSLALLALASAHPTDSLNQPKPRPLLSAYRFRVGLVGAPEFSTVRADRLVKPGSSLGVMLEYQLGRRWRVSAGYLYTNKLYAARGTDYTLPAGYTLPHGYVISNVDAACRIVDIPLNLRYDLWQRPRYQLFISAGLSSLLMRREQYTYDYELLYGKPVAPYSWELDNGSQHALKVLNLSAGYERAVGLRWTVQAEPFVKLPLAGVGFGAVRLSSAGVFFSLKYGLLPVRPAPAPR